MSKATNLFRMLRVGERVSFDSGRIIIGLEDKSGRTARLKLTLAEDVVVDKPRVSANDEEPSIKSPGADVGATGA